MIDSSLLIGLSLLGVLILQFKFQSFQALLSNALGSSEKSTFNANGLRYGPCAFLICLKNDHEKNRSSLPYCTHFLSRA